MGSLLKTPYSEVTATIERLDHLGVTAADFKRIRTNNSAAAEIADVLFGSRGNRKTTALITQSPFFADEEVASEYDYPEGYAVKPVCEQLVELSRHFPELDTSSVLSFSKEMRELPAGAEGWFAVPKWEKVGKTYHSALETVLAKIAGSRKFCNYRKGDLGPKYLRLSERTSTALEMLGENQEGDYLLIPAQFGMRHRGRSVRRVREIIGNSGEFGLGAFAVGCMTLAHPERFVLLKQLHVDCAGDEYAPDAGAAFSCAPVFDWYDDRVWFYAYWVDSPCSCHGSASGFLPAEAR